MIISTLANPNVIKVTNPKYKTQTSTKQSIIVSIKKDGRTYIGQQQIVFDSLYAELSKRIDIKDTTIKQSVVINADTSISYNNLIKALGDAKRAGAAVNLGVDAH
ncbi:ExbD/TolR family protein [Ferruginibacter sp.]